MHRAGIDYAHLGSGLTKILAHNRQFGTAVNENVYPSIRERRAFIRQVVSAVTEMERIDSVWLKAVG